MAEEQRKLNRKSSVAVATERKAAAQEDLGGKSGIRKVMVDAPSKKMKGSFKKETEDVDIKDPDELT